MKGTPIFFYIFVMWLSIIAGGMVFILIIAHIPIHGFGKLDSFIDSAVKAGIAILLVVLWIMVMSKIKNWIFQKEISN